MTPDPHVTPPPWPLTDERIRVAMDRMLSDGSWGRYHGPHCDALKSELTAFHEIEHVHLCSSGTSAVELALRAANVRSGDEVVLAAYDYKANFANVLTLGAKPVLVDTLPGIPVMDPAQLAAAMTPGVKAVICSHLHGCMAPIDRIIEVARQSHATVIEDACQVQGASIHNRRAGTIGDVGVLSFGGSKLLTAGRGGAVLTQNAGIAQRLRLYTQRGNDAYPLSEMQAAVLLPQLQQLDERNQQRSHAVGTIRDALAPTAPLQMIAPVSDYIRPAWYKLAFRYDAPGSESRIDFASRMRSLGIALDPGFQALHLTHAKSRFRPFGDLSNASLLHDQLLTLHHPVLLSDDTNLQHLIGELGKSSGGVE